MNQAKMDRLSWLELNDTLREATEDLCRDMLMLEQAGKKRTEYLRRIHERLNRTRSERERRELKEGGE